MLGPKALTQIKTYNKKASFEQLNSTLLNVFKRRINKVQLIRQEELFRYNQLATLGELSAGLTHEIVTPLSNIKFNLSVIKCQEKSSIKEELSAALNGVEHIDSLIQSYLSHLKGEDRYMYFAPHDEISKAQNLLEFRIRKNRIKLLTEVDKKALILGNPIKFNQVIINLLKNAIDTYKSSDQSDLEESEDDFKVIEIKEQSSNTHFKLKIVDFGAGIEPQNKHKIFDKFFTTKPLGEGTGLGLPICKNIIEKNFNGRLNLISLKTPTIFQISIPWPEKMKSKAKKYKLIKLEDHLESNYTKEQINEIKAGAKKIISRTSKKS